MNKILTSLSVLLVSMALAAGETRVVSPDGFIPVWTVAGPFPAEIQDPGGESRGGYYHDFLAAAGGERYTIPAVGDRIELESATTIVWKNASPNAAGVLDFISLFAVEPGRLGIAYAFCLLNSETEQDVLLKVGSNDGVRIWLNEKMVHDHHVARGLVVGEDPVPVTLKKGRNRLLGKVENLGGSWALSVQVMNQDERPAGGIAAVSAAEGFSLQDHFSVRWQQSPFVLRTAQGEAQLLQAEILSNGLEEVAFRISAPAWPEDKIFRIGRVAAGNRMLDFQLPVVATDTPIKINLESKTRRQTWSDIVFKKPRRRTVYLVQHTHTDIGYTRPQSEMLAEHLRYIDYALDCCDATDDFPDDAKFRWTCEVAWPVQEFLKRRPPAQGARFLQRVQEGRIEVAGMFLNMAETATENSMAASLQPLLEFKQKYGIPVRTAMQNDVNGAAWCLVDYFSGMGVKYLTMGINKTRSLLPFDLPTPFWWESPSGKRMLAYRAEHYHMGNVWRMHEGRLGPLRDGILGYLAQLDQNGYRFDHAYAQFSGYHTDNAPPAVITSRLIRRWNELYASPKLRLATAHEFFQWIEQEKGAELPVFRVAWPDWWTDGFGSAARETAAARTTHVSLQTSETTLALAAWLGTPVTAQARARWQYAQEQLLFYDEHTFGAAESVGDPQAENTRVQWNQKSAYVWDAAKLAGLLRDEASASLRENLPAAEEPTIAVWNTLNWERSGLIELFIDHEIIPQNSARRIIDAVTGREIPTQRLSTRTEGSFWLLWVDRVPALGYKILRIGETPKTVPPRMIDAHQLENGFYRIEIDPATGDVLRLFDKELHVELVDPNAQWKIGQLLHEQLNDDQRQLKTGAFTRTPVKNVRRLERISGPIWQSLRFAGDLAGCNGVQWEYRLFETTKRIDLHFTLRKQPVPDPEAIYVAFPFQLDGGIFTYEAQGGFVTPGENQVPRSASDWQTVQNFISLRNNAAQVVLGSNEIPLVQFGGLNLGKWQENAQISQPHVYSWVMNNYWFTNFCATQEGELRWSYYLTSTGETEKTAAVQFGWGSRIALQARVIPAGRPKAERRPAASWLNWPAANLILVAARPAPDGKGIVCHLREVAGITAKIELTELSSLKKIQQMDEVNVLGEVLQNDVQSVRFAPFEVKFIRLISQ
ncbi:MAG TPA: glycoside hydrolase family 38 C-terminal domain-containing protein [bacterium]|nr:glycoside hydrolase family 38 C-terminal domain-containing protein [bacterium]HPN36683.1 glycoside hydrolase family 38 C-terminal domain-containing protein [bacterium]